MMYSVYLPVGPLIWEIECKLNRPPYHARILSWNAWIGLMTRRSKKIRTCVIDLIILYILKRVQVVNEGVKAKILTHIDDYTREEITAKNVKELAKKYYRTIESVKYIPHFVRPKGG